MKAHRLSTAILLALIGHPALVAAADQDPHHDEKRLERVEVEATPLKQSAEELNQPVAVLSGSELDAVRANTLGDTVDGLPGVSASNFGPGAARPVIRGLDGARVQTLSSGLSTLDVSTVSVDHAVTVDPFLADQIEVLKGPATVLFGSGAIGGAVNVVDGRIPTWLPQEPGEVHGRAAIQASDATEARIGLLRLDTGTDRFAFHLDASHRDTGDIEIPGFAESAALLALEGEEPDPDTRGVLENSATRTSSLGLGASWIGDGGMFGMSYASFDTVYGVPGHAHEHEEEDHDGEEDDDHDHEGEEEASIRIDMKQERWDAHGSLLQPISGLESLNIKVAHTDYEHVELEGDEVGTRFENNAVEARVEAVHADWNGWEGAWGVQHARRDFSAVGEEAFVPPTLTRDLGLFLVERRDLGEAWSLDLGARVDRVRVEPDALPDRRFTSKTLSAALGWDVAGPLRLNLSLDRAQRAPTAEELFSNGPHAATQAFEVGDAALDLETAQRIEIGAHWHAPGIDVEAAIYRTSFDDFIYLAETGEEEDGLPLRQWTQDGARFHGAEISADFALLEGETGAWVLQLMADSVRGRLDDGGNLPRIPARRTGATLQWSNGGWRASLGARHHARQDRVAEFELPSDSYTLVHADLVYAIESGYTTWELFLQGRNLSDDEARPHTSFLKDLAPLAGREWTAGVRVMF